MSDHAQKRNDDDEVVMAWSGSLAARWDANSYLIYGLTTAATSVFPHDVAFSPSALEGVGLGV